MFARRSRNQHAGPASGGTAGSGGASSAEAGDGGSGSAEAGSGGISSAEAGNGGISSAEAGNGGISSTGTPFAPRNGSFKMLVYSRTELYRHGPSIESGKKMLEEIAEEHDFEVTMTETNEDITPDGLSKYELVFFLNTTGDIFDGTEQQAFEEWMTSRNGAFAGVHAATDTEPNWQFYKEMTGQYVDGSELAGTPGEILIEDSARDFPGMADLPNPWPRLEEWLKFSQHEVWSAKPGFEILARNAANNHPVSWIREFVTFRSFYTLLGHEGEVYEDGLVKQHVAGGILWAVRREHLFQ